MTDDPTLNLPTGTYRIITLDPNIRGVILPAAISLDDLDWTRGDPEEAAYAIDLPESEDAAAWEQLADGEIRHHGFTRISPWTFEGSCHQALIERRETIETSHDEYVPDVEHQALWVQAGSIEDLGKLTARWLTREITYQPGYVSPEPDLETQELVPVLAELNRAGFVTDFSQPGVELDHEGNGQRAAVTGFCSATTAARLQEALCRTELVYLADEVSQAGGVSLVVTMNAGQEFTWLGRGPDLDPYVEDLSPELFVRLREAVYLVVVDPRWGRNELLWSTLRTALVDPADAGEVK